MSLKNKTNKKFSTGGFSFSTLENRKTEGQPLAGAVEKMKNEELGHWTGAPHKRWVANKDWGSGASGVFFGSTDYKL